MTRGVAKNQNKILSNGYYWSRPIQYQYLSVSSRCHLESSTIFYKLKLKIASYYWLSFNKVQRHEHVDGLDMILRYNKY